VSDILFIKFGFVRWMGQARCIVIMKYYVAVATFRSRGVDSASDINEYQGSSLGGGGVNAAGAWG
jgi:hypothetical protein